MRFKPLFFQGWYNYPPRSRKCLKSHENGLKLNFMDEYTYDELNDPPCMEVVHLKKNPIHDKRPPDHESQRLMLLIFFICLFLTPLSWGWLILGGMALLTAICDAR